MVAAAVTVGALVASSSAMAAAPTGIYAKFKGCPYNNAAVQTCLLSTNTVGSFKFGNANVPLSVATPVILQGGYSLGDSDGVTTWYDAANGYSSVPAQPLKVPGGLIGLVSTGGFSGLLIDLFNAAVASVNDVYATAEVAGPIKFDYLNYVLSLDDPAVTLPIKVHLTNPFLGSSCYIGSNSSPITLKLTDGTTHPPAPNTSITGSLGTLTVDASGTILTAVNSKLVDNSFSVPAATNCGFLPLDKLVITAAVNLKEGLPSAAGKNSATLQGNSDLSARDYVVASVH